MLSDDEKKKLNNRLRRVIGQVEAVGRMIEDEEYCVDILMQLSAATGALNKVRQLGFATFARLLQDIAA